MAMRIRATADFRLPDGSRSIAGTIYSGLDEGFCAARIGEGRAEDVDGILIATSLLDLKQRVSDGRVINEKGDPVAVGGGVEVRDDAAQVVASASSLDFQGALKAGASGGGAVVLLDQASTLATPVPSGIPGFIGYTPYRSAKKRGSRMRGYPRRRNLMSWTDTTSVNFRLATGTGSITAIFDDPTIGEPYQASNASAGNAPTNGRGLRIGYGANSAMVIGDKVVLPAPVDLTGKNVYLSFKLLSGDPSLLTVNVRLISNTVVNGTASEANYHAADFIQPSSAQIKVGAWMTMAMPIEAFTAAGTGATLTAITHIYLHVNATSAGALQIGDVFFCPRPLARGVVIIGFDDCRADTWMHGARYLRKYGLPAVLYPGAVGKVIRQDIDQFQMTPAQMKHLQKLYGWQIASQAWSTENPDVDKPGQTLEQFAAELAGMSAFYADQDWDGEEDSSYYSSVSRGGPRDAVFERAYSTMRTFVIWSAGTAPSAHPECVPLADPMTLKAWGMDTSIHNLALTSAFVDKAIAQKGVARFVFHGVDVATAAFTQLIDYIAQKNLEGTLDVMTEQQLGLTIAGRAFA